MSPNGLRFILLLCGYENYQSSYEQDLLFLDETPSILEITQAKPDFEPHENYDWLKMGISVGTYAWVGMDFGFVGRLKNLLICSHIYIIVIKLMSDVSILYYIEYKIKPTTSTSLALLSASSVMIFVTMC